MLWEHEAVGSNPTAPTTTLAVMSGTDDPSGTWTLTVHRLLGTDGKGGVTTVNGPWVFAVQVP